YVYIYLSNENTTPVEVFFDDFKVTHTPTDIVQKDDYYPFGGTFNSYISGVKNKYLYNGKEIQEETQWYDFGARMQDPWLGRWMIVDPLAHEFPWQSPYAAFDNNPINKIDPTGMAAVDWKPEVDENGNTSYVAEQGDNAATLADQYGLTQQQADKLVGGKEVKAGETRISGEEAKNVTGKDVLKLDLNSKMATDQRIIDQAVFAMDHSKRKGDWGFYSTGYFGGTKYKNVVNASGSITIDGQSIPLELQLPVYRSATFDGSSTSIFLGNTPYRIKPTTGNRFPQTDLLFFDMYHPNTKNKMQDYIILSPRNGSEKIYNRLNN
ncbi:RHS repeat-associated core domain-containing protein, partial [Algoriphagus sp. C2-6-M1]|uniref:RHS repeat-associated core domain-containing protein n=1 Tax=Algoriphagus persicinus TaxID=3108754 RepID=UPI002B3A6C43